MFPGVDPAALKVLDLAPRLCAAAARETDRPLLLTAASLPPCLSPLALPESRDRDRPAYTGVGRGPAEAIGLFSNEFRWHWADLRQIPLWKPCDFGQTLRPLTFRLLLYKIQKASLHPGNAQTGA